MSSSEAHQFRKRLRSTVLANSVVGGGFGGLCFGFGGLGVGCFFCPVRLKTDRNLYSFMGNGNVANLQQHANNYLSFLLSLIYWRIHHLWQMSVNTQIHWSRAHFLQKCSWQGCLFLLCTECKTCCLIYREKKLKLRGFGALLNSRG